MLFKCSGKYIEIYFSFKITFRSFLMVMMHIHLDSMSMARILYLLTTVSILHQRVAEAIHLGATDRYMTNPHIQNSLNYQGSCDGAISWRHNCMAVGLPE